MINGWDNTGNIVAVIPKAEGMYHTSDRYTGFAETYNGPASTAFRKNVLDSFSSGYGYLYNSGDAYYNFDGINDRFEIRNTTTSSLPELDNCATATWKYTYTPLQTPDMNRILTNVNDVTHRISFETNVGDEKLYIAIYNGASYVKTAWMTGWNNTNYPINNVYDIVITFNGGASTDATKIKLYINKVQKTLTFLTTSNIPATLPVIGANKDVNIGMYGRQTLTHLSIYNVEKSSSWVSTVYDLGPDLNGIVGSAHATESGIMLLAASASTTKVFVPPFVTNYIGGF
jgi:hypothetical protein